MHVVVCGVSARGESTYLPEVSLRDDELEDWCMWLCLATSCLSTSLPTRGESQGLCDARVQQQQPVQLVLGEERRGHTRRQDI